MLKAEKKDGMECKYKLYVAEFRNLKYIYIYEEE